MCAGRRKNSVCLAIRVVDKIGSTLEWLHRQRRNTTQAVRDLQVGQKIEFNGTDVTAEWITRYERLIERYTRLIEKYEQQEREASLRGTVKFRE